MRFEILNVEHGSAAYAIAEDGSVLVFDCGLSSTMRLSTLLYDQDIRQIKRLFILNYDEDHVGDLPALREKFQIDVLTCNLSISASQLEEIKAPTSDAMDSVIDMLHKYTNPTEVQHAGIAVSFFYNSYPSFTDPNNLSLLVFIKMGGTCIALGGDLEVAGWKSILKKQEVRDLLKQVNYFVASHHGRESGYCEEVFQYCQPKAIIFSDGPIKHDTQEMAAVYGKHAQGIVFNGQPRKVLTTRQDGSLHWDL